MERVMKKSKKNAISKKENVTREKYILSQIYKKADHDLETDYMGLYQSTNHRLKVCNLRFALTKISLPMVKKNANFFLFSYIKPLLNPLKKEEIIYI